MTGVVQGLVLALCVVLFTTGLGLLGSEAAGVQRLAGRTTTGSASRPSGTRSVRRALARRLAGAALALMTSNRRAEIRHRIAAAGRPGGTLEEHAGYQALLAILLGLVGLLLAVALRSPLFVPALAFAGWLQPDVALLARANRRQARIDRDLPDFLDVLSVTVSAGLGFRSALALVADALGGPLGHEVRTALQQISYGVASRTAFEGLRDRSDSESLHKFILALLQAEDLGAPLSETLATIAVDVRKGFSQRARSDAARAVPRVSLVVTLVMVPGLLVLVAGALISTSGSGLGGLLG